MYYYHYNLYDIDRGSGFIPHNENNRWPGSWGSIILENCVAKRMYGVTGTMYTMPLMFLGDGVGEKKYSGGSYLSPHKVELINCISDYNGQEGAYPGTTTGGTYNYPDSGYIGYFAGTVNTHNMGVIYCRIVMLLIKMVVFIQMGYFTPLDGNFTFHSNNQHNGVTPTPGFSSFPWNGLYTTLRSNPYMS